MIHTAGNDVAPQGAADKRGAMPPRFFFCFASFSKETSLVYLKRCACVSSIQLYSALVLGGTLNRRVLVHLDRH